MTQRVINTKQAAEMLGLSAESFRIKRKDGTLPIEPVPYCSTRYDSRQIEQYLDSQLKVEKEASYDYDRIIQERLANRGQTQCEISRSAAV